jgi:hypothetical protein
MQSVSASWVVPSINALSLLPSFVSLLAQVDFCSATTPTKPVLLKGKTTNLKKDLINIQKKTKSRRKNRFFLEKVNFFFFQTPASSMKVRFQFGCIM